MTTPILAVTCELPSISEKEVLRYAEAKDTTQETHALLLECIAECEGKFANQVAFRRLPIKRGDGKLFIGSMVITSNALKKNLENCDEVLLMVASAGLEIDRLIAKYAAFSPAKSLMFHCIGTERVEALCDAFCKTFETQENLKLKPRFSPGYGDLALEHQKEILHLLNAGNLIGVCMNDSLLLSPSKSVTAFAGIENKKER